MLVEQRHSEMLLAGLNLVLLLDGTGSMGSQINELREKIDRELLTELRKM